MGQQEIYKLLKKKDHWLLSKEILNITEMSPGGLYRLLRVLEKNKEITKRRATEVIKDKKRLNGSSKNRGHSK